MVQLIEGTHYRRRENQPSPAPHKSKKVVDCLLCIDPGDDDDAHGDHIRSQRSRPIGINIRLDRFVAHIKSNHPDACRNEARSLLTMGFTRRNVGAGATAPEGDEHKRMAASSLINASVAGQDPQVVESSELGIAPFAAEQDAHNLTTSSLGNATSSAGHDLGSLRTAQSQRIRQPSLSQATTTTPSTAIVERITVTESMNF